MGDSKPLVRLLESISQLASTTDAWISDVWGVLHNGLRAYRAASDACLRFRMQGGTVVLVTNAPRPEADVSYMLDDLKVPREAYDAIVTSGDVSLRLIENFPGRTIFHLGPVRSQGILSGLPDLVSDPSAAELVVCTGLVDDEHETPEDYRTLLAQLAQRHVPMICANPDIVVERGDRLVPCAGALAQVYHAMGGPVHYAGKPHSPIYERAFEVISERRGALPDKARILAIGDGLRTDLEGATRAGLRSVFIASALHVSDVAHFDQQAVTQLFATSDVRPVAAMQALAW
jgi:HAD superfamily hydrolase (TIGR01459 family)